MQKSKISETETCANCGERHLFKRMRECDGCGQLFCEDCYHEFLTCVEMNALWDLYDE